MTFSPGDLVQIKRGHAFFWDRQPNNMVYEGNVGDLGIVLYNVISTINNMVCIFINGQVIVGVFESRFSLVSRARSRSK